MLDNLSNNDRANVLVEALPYIQNYDGKIVVIKYGGNAMINEELKQDVMRDIVLLHHIGVKVVLVHGGGPEISDLLSKIGHKSEFVDGLRVTDEVTVDAVLMALSGKVNKLLVNNIQKIGGNAVGICGIDGHFITAEKKDDVHGFVGRITDVDTKLVNDMLDNGYIPVISTVGVGDDGTVYNINADTAAAKIAGKLGAENLILMTDIRGVLKDKDDENTLIPLIKVSDAEKLTEQGIISDGMIPKVKCCTDAIKDGVKKVIILDGRVNHSILIEMLTDEGVGTMFE